MTKQGREGTTPESTREIMEENDREEGKAKSRRACIRMITSGRTKTTGTW